MPCLRNRRPHPAGDVPEAWQCLCPTTCIVRRSDAQTRQSLVWRRSSSALGAFQSFDRPNVSKAKHCRHFNVVWPAIGLPLLSACLYRTATTSKLAKSLYFNHRPKQSNKKCEEAVLNYIDTISE